MTKKKKEYKNNNNKKEDTSIHNTLGQIRDSRETVKLQL